MALMELLRWLGFGPVAAGLFVAVPLGHELLGLKPRVSAWTRAALGVAVLLGLGAATGAVEINVGFVFGVLEDGWNLAKGFPQKKRLRSAI